MGEHELLLRHTEAWASAKNRTLDRDLLATAIRLWTEQEEHLALEWPEGSAEMLLLHRWPAHEPVQEADVGPLVESLETFWRFLRATGRMRSGSADPKVLVKEARRAAPKIPVACADPQHRLMAVLEGLTARGADDDEDEEFEDEDEEFERDSFDVDYRYDEAWALLPGNLEGWADDPPVELSAAETKRSPFIQTCLRFAQWVGAGKRVTSGVLRPAQIREASVDFDLAAWEREFLHRSPWREPGLGDSPVLRGRALDGILGDLDSVVTTRALQSLWYACESAGLIKIGSTTVCASPAAGSQDEWSADDWAQVGHAAIASAVVTRHFQEPLDPVLRVLLPFLRDGVDHVAVADVRDWWWEHDANQWRSLGLGLTQARRLSDRQVDRLLWAVDDTGIWRREGQRLHRTALGMDVAMRFLNELPDLLEAM